MLITACSSTGPHQCADTEIILSRVQEALLLYAAKNHGDYPQSHIDFLASVHQYDAPTTDAWGHPLLYFSTQTGYRLVSLGRDGVAGGADLRDMDLIRCSGDDALLVASTAPLTSIGDECR